MIKIIILATPVEGHFYPFIPIAELFYNRGHEMVFITGKKFEKRVINTGARFIPLPDKWDTDGKEVYEIFPELKKLKGLAQIKFYLKHILLDQAIDVLNELKNVLEEFHADIVMFDTFQIAGSWINEFGSQPNVLLSVLPLHLPEKNIAPYGLGLLPGKGFFSKLRNNLLSTIFENLLFKDILVYANNIRKQLGLPDYEKNFLTESYQKNNFILHISIPTFEYSRSELPANFRFIGPVLIPPQKDYNKPDWWPEVNKGYPVILINQGTIAKDLDNLILPAIEALKNEKMTIIAVPVKKGEISNLPENTHTEPFIPFGNLLPHVDILITNGGFGGTQHALTHGIPVVIAGATEDKMEIAARVESAGAGINLRKQKPRPKDIKKAIMKILSNSSYKENAQMLQSEFAKYDAPTSAVEIVEELFEKSNK
jgi:MGT family glycosyltransferase